MSKKQTVESLWARIDVRSLEECWPWLGGHNNSGYGTVVWDGKVVCAHRLALWTLGLVDTIAAPIDRKGSGFALHSCDNAGCCNPTHFDFGTYAKNNTDCYTRIRRTQPQGQHHINAKLLPDAIWFIRAHTGKIRQIDLAKQYGVSQRCISLVQRNETYRNLPC